MEVQWKAQQQQFALAVLKCTEEEELVPTMKRHICALVFKRNKKEATPNFTS
jgi:hypothetical protein